MGLDGVELIMATEDEFGIAIPDDDAWKLATPRLLADYVAQRLAAEGRVPDSRCISQVRFYRIRRYLIEHANAERKAIAPGSLLEAILNPELRKHWRQIKTSIGMNRMPNLRPAPPLRWLLNALPVFAAVFVFVLSDSILAALGTLILVAMLAVDAWRRLANQLPASMTTVADLLPYIRTEELRNLLPDEILLRVLKITSEQLGIPLQKIQPDHSFVKDLGLD